MKMIDVNELMMPNHWRNLSATAYKEVVSVLKSFPTVEVEPVIYANWEMYPVEIEGLSEMDIRCSNCKSGYVNPTFKRCPECGAIMRKEIKNDRC